MSFFLFLDWHLAQCLTQSSKQLLIEYMLLCLLSFLHILSVPVFFLFFKFVTSM